MNINNLKYLEEVDAILPCVYALVDPIDEEVRYIGKSLFVQSRYYQHIKASTRELTPLYQWIKRLTEQNLYPRLFILEKCGEEELPEKEKEWIKKVNENGARLFNFGGKRFYNYNPYFLNRIANTYGGKLITNKQVACNEPQKWWCGDCQKPFLISGERLVKGQWCSDCTQNEVESTGKNATEIQASRVMGINHILNEMLT